MPIALHTGLPGAGKSLGLVERLVKLMKDEPERPVYAVGIDGLREGIAEPLDSPELWEELPHGAIIVIDECQEYMPTDRGNTPNWIRALSKHRHMGMDFLIATQHPSLISTYVRRLVAEHVHHVRKFGTGVVDRYRWPKCMDAPETAMARREAIKSLWTFPKECFSLYKSATVHTIKRRLPRKLYVFVALVLIGLTAVGATVWQLHRAKAQSAASVAAAAGVSPAASPSSLASSDLLPSDRLRRTDYAKWLRPRVAGVPWSAPAFDHLQVQAHPRIFCIAGEDGRCNCITEQGTKYVTPLKVCRKIAANGVYDPFLREGRPDRVGAREGQAAQAALLPSPPDLHGATGISGPPRGWGTDLADPYVPPEWSPSPSGGQATSKYMQSATR